MARDHMTQLTVTVNVLMLSSETTHIASSNFLVHSTKWHLQGSEIFRILLAGQATVICTTCQKRHTAQVDLSETLPCGLFCIEFHKPDFKRFLIIVLQ